MNEASEAQRDARREQLVRRIGRSIGAILGGLGFLVLAGYALFFLGAGFDVLVSPNTLGWPSVALGSFMLGYALHLIYMIVLIPLAPQFQRSALTLNVLAAALFVTGFVSSLGSVVRGSFAPFESALPFLLLAFLSALMVSVSIGLAGYYAGNSRHAV